MTRFMKHATGFGAILVAVASCVASAHREGWLLPGRMPFPRADTRAPGYIGVEEDRGDLSARIEADVAGSGRRRPIVDEPARPPLGLPPVPWPADNPYSRDKAELGKWLFFDRRLSSDGSIACATCHDPAKAFADGAVHSRGIGGRRGLRNAPTI